MKNSARHAALVAAVGGLALTGWARADSVTVTLDNVSPSRIVGVTYNNQSLGSVYAGALNWHGQAGNVHDLTGSFSTFCIDLTQDVYLGSTYTYVVADPSLAPDPLPPTESPGSPGLGAASLQRIENLYALQYDGIGSDNDRGAAFQIAIWEMLFDTGATHDVTAGQFAVTGASANVVTLANQFVSDALTPDALSFHNELLALTSRTAQDQLFVGAAIPQGGPPLAAVPTPAAAIGATPLLGALAFFKRRRRRRDEL
jgi:hypothetical protein